MAEVRLANIKKIYPNQGGTKKKKGEAPEKKNNLQITEEGVVAVQQFSLDIADREFIVLVGPSGCGKSTTLRMIAGLEEITSGDLFIDGKRVNDVAPKDRDIAMVFQNYALYPHMTVYENMAFSLKLKKLPKAEIDKKVREAAEILDITALLDRKPKALSGGQRQRVAIGRAIVRSPKVFLMDEPLSGDRIVIMRDGFIQQIGTPQEVFDKPANLFVAGFIGTPQMNFFDAELKRDGDKYTVEVCGEQVKLTEDKQAALLRNGVPAGPVTLGIRPEHIVLAKTGGIPARVDVSEMMGSSVHLHLTAAGHDAVVIVPTLELDAIPSYGQQVSLELHEDSIHLFDRETEKSLLL